MIHNTYATQKATPYDFHDFTRCFFPKSKLRCIPLPCTSGFRKALSTGLDGETVFPMGFMPAHLWDIYSLMAIEIDYS